MTSESYMLITSATIGLACFMLDQCNYCSGITLDNRQSVDGRCSIVRKLSLIILVREQGEMSGRFEAQCGPPHWMQ